MDKSKRNIMWRPVEGYEEYYLVSSEGQIWSTRLGRALKPGLTGKCRNYLQVNLYKGSKKTVKRVKVHRIVADTFIPNPSNKPQVNHKNGVTTDNRLVNLEWVTNGENQKHAYLTGLQKPATHRSGIVGELSPNHKVVLQYDLSGNFIKKHSGINQCAKNLGISYSGIVLVCQGKRKTAGGFIWRYNK